MGSVRWILLLASDVLLAGLAVIGLWSLWKKAARKATRIAVVITILLAILAIGFKASYGVWRHYRVEYLRSALADRIQGGQSLGDDLMKLRSDALVSEAAQRVDRWYTDAMYWMDCTHEYRWPDCGEPGMATVFGTTAKDIPHEKTIEWVRRHLDNLLGNMRQILAGLDQYVRP